MSGVERWPGSRLKLPPNFVPDKKIFYYLSVSGICNPNRFAPQEDHLITLGSGRRGDDIVNSDQSTVFRQDKSRPLLLLLSKLHVYLLDLPAREMLFNVQVKADKSKCQPDRLFVINEILRRICINNVLMDKGWIAMRQRIVLKFFVCLLICLHNLPIRTGPSLSGADNKRQTM